MLRDPEELFGIVAERCDGCGEAVVRINPRTGKREWLNGARINSPDDAGRVTSEAAPVLVVGRGTRRSAGPKGGCL